jgi:hypothetical protein
MFFIFHFFIFSFFLLKILLLLWNKRRFVAWRTGEQRYMHECINQIVFFPLCLYGCISMLVVVGRSIDSDCGAVARSRVLPTTTALRWNCKYCYCLCTSLVSFCCDQNYVIADTARASCRSVGCSGIGASTMRSSRSCRFACAVCCSGPLKRACMRRDFFS